ncbi:MAG: FtsX-like permease family protein [Rhodothermales bacterium]
MIRNYAKIALRNLLKYKGYTFINVFGLALGLVTCLFILQFIQDERSYDQFHEKGERIHQIGMRGVIGGQFMEIANSGTPMGPTLKQDYPEIEQFVRVKSMGRVLFERENTQFYEDAVYWADSTFFSVFSFPLLRGDEKTALAAPNTIVLTESAARKYFGTAVDPIGQTLRFENRADYEITGIVADVPAQSHLQFDILVSMESVIADLNVIWLSHHLHTYIVLTPQARISSIEAKFPDLVERYVAPEFEQFTGTSLAEARKSGMEFGYYTQPLSGLYLDHVGSDAIGVTSDIKYLYILGAIALFILLLAFINFMNLSTARSAQRAKEVGMRKVLGSERKQLIWQFLGESVVLAFVAFFVAGLLFLMMRPMFNSLAGKTLVLSWETGLLSLSILFGLSLFSGLMAGIYPALVLSAFKPITVLKGKMSTGAKGSWLRGSLIVVQFTVSVMLLIGTGVVFSQIQYMQNERLGFSGEQVVVLPIEEGQEQYETFRQALMQHPGVLAVAASDYVPGRVGNATAYRPEEAPAAETFVLSVARVSHDYLETLEINLVAGRDFSKEFSTDVTNAMLINVAGVKEFGWTPEEALGKRVHELAAGEDGEDISRSVIGVVEDFHFESLHESIGPLAMNIDQPQYQRLSVRIAPENMAATMGFLQTEWEMFEPGYPYNSVFLSADFNRFYAEEQRLGRIFVVFTILAIIIACLGLFGLASFITQQRTKEIGVRKTLGATVPGIVLMLSKEFTRLVLISAAVAVPLSYLLMSRWLEGFAFQVGLNWWIFVGAVAGALLMAWLTVGYQSIKAAVMNPIKALRYE